MKKIKPNNIVEDFNYIRKTILKLHGETAEMFEIQLKLLVESMQINEQSRYERLPKNNIIKIYVFTFNSKSYGVQVLFVGEPLRAKHICMTC